MATAPTTAPTTSTAPAPKKKLSRSQQLTQQYTGAATDAAQTRITGLTSQIDSLGADRDVSSVYEGSTEAAGTYHSEQGTWEAQRKKDIAYNTDLSEQRSGLQSQMSAQQSILDNPLSTLTSQQSDMIQGVTFAEGVIGEDGLGRLGDDSTMQGIESRFQEMSQGYNSQEMLARREKGLEQISGDTASRTRSLQAKLGSMGVKGAQAGQQAMNLQAAGVQARGNMERDLLIANRDAQVSGLDKYSQFTQGVKQFDLGQAAKETDLMMQSALGLGKMGTQERVDKHRAQMEKEAAATQSYWAHYDD